MTLVPGALRRAALAFIVGCVLLQAFATPGVAADHRLVDGDRSPSVARQATPTNNTTAVRHENPDDVRDDGDLRAVRSHLIRQLSERLRRSSVELDRAQYDRARQLLGDDYNGSLEKLVDVAGETEQRDSVDEFRRARDAQRSFVTSVQRYRETHEEYVRAEEAGDEQRVRRLARQLDRIARNTTKRGQTVIRTYSDLENTTGVDPDRAIAIADNTTRTIAEQQSEIRAGEFVSTTLTVSASSRNASFLDPLRLHGRLATTDGTAVADRSITLRVGGQVRQLTTDDDGRFSLTYRPRTVPLSLSRLSVRYLPAETSRYLSSNASLPVNIAQTTATISIRNHSSTATYGDLVHVRGRLVAGNVSVGRVPMRLTVDDVSVETVRTASDGSFRLTTRLPASVTTGRRTLAVGVAHGNRAITAVPVARPLRVSSTTTDLSVTARERDGLVVTGRLRTGDWDPIAGQSVTVLIDGTTSAAVTTDATGWYRVMIDPPAGAETVAIAATFSGEGTNLAQSRAETRLSLSGEPPGSRPEGVSIYLLPGVISGIILISGVTVYLRRRYSEAPVPSTDAPASAPQSDPAQSSVDRSLEAVRGSLESDPDAAVEAAYSLVRRLLVPALATRDQVTHWEFYRACLAADLGIDPETFRSLTQLYEHAAYSATHADSETARQALTLAETLVDQVETPASSVSAD